jgi:hypothetical protein
VRYQSIYPGIDLVYYGTARALEYDFRVAPGADPSCIRLGFTGATNVTITPEGDLLLETPAGPVCEHVPVIFQESDGRRERIAGSYVLAGAQEVAFRIGSYDPKRELVIDPVILYSSYLSGSNNDIANDLRVDGSGYVYLTGSTTSPDFPTVPPSNLRGNKDMFVTKLSPDGQTIVYSTYLGQGESGGDEATSLFVDDSGNAYIAGTISKLLLLGDAHYTVVGKLNSDGSLAFLNRVSGTSGIANEQVSGIALDKTHNIYLSGWTDIDTIPLVGQFQSVPATTGSGFVLMLDPAGQNVLFSTYIGSSGMSRANGLAVDSDGYVYVTGQTSGIPTTPGAFQPNVAGDLDAYVMKIDPRRSGTAAIIYSTYLGGGELDTGNAIKVDAQGTAWVTGATKSNNSSQTPVKFPVTANAAQQHLGWTLASTAYCNGSAQVDYCPDVFIAGLTADGAALVYSTYLGGDGPDVGQALAVDPDNGRIYVTGQACNFFPVTPDATQSSSTTCAGAFLAVIDPAQQFSLVFSTLLSGSASDQGSAVARDPSGNIWVAGSTTSTNFPLVHPLMTVGGGNGPSLFVTRYALSAAPSTNPLAISLVAGKVSMTWSGGNLQEASYSTGPFQDVAGAVSPYTVSADGPSRFYRLR